MKPVRQTIATGPRANCVAACLASILECELAEVPQPTAREGCEWDAWQGYMARLNEWLAGRNLTLLPMGLRDASGEIVKPRGYALLGVTQARTGHPHSVVARDGEIVWDPAVGAPAQYGEWLDWMLFGALDPARR